MRHKTPVLFGIGLLALATWCAAEVTNPDIVVAADGSGKFKTVQEAVASVPKDNRDRIVISVKDGVYHEKVRVDAANVSLIGQSREHTRIEFPQLSDDFQKSPDNLGQAVININGDGFVLQNLTVENTAGVVGPHAFAVYGRADKVVITDCNVLSDGADTLSLWKGDTGRYYHARCNFRGSVDFVCPRGWCYAVDCTFKEMKNTAAIWHDGSKNESQKFVLKNCTFDGVDGWVLGRHHHDGQFFLLDCTFSKTMADQPIERVVYPLDGAPPTDADKKRNADLDKTNIWGERSYFYNCHRDGGDYAWFANNFDKAKSSPKPDEVTAKWTFDGSWDPESTASPAITNVNIDVEGLSENLVITFSEAVTVKGRPKLMWKSGEALYDYGSGTKTLTFLVKHPGVEVVGIDTASGQVIASGAGAQVRPARLDEPMAK